MEDFAEGITYLMYKYATDGTLSFEEAKKKLYDDAYVRTVGETLSKYCHIDRNDTNLLKKELVELLCETDPSAEKESISRAVRMWINGNMQFISRSNAIKIAFALKLNIKDAEELLWRLCGEGFHWRDTYGVQIIFHSKTSFAILLYRKGGFC